MIINILKLVYFTFLHNYQVIGFFCLASLSLYRLIKQPSRPMTLFFIGFLILILHFEYQKHIVANLAEQTVDVLFADQTHYRTQWLVKIGFYHLLPLILWLSGWLCIALGLHQSDNKKAN